MIAGQGEWGGPLTVETSRNIVLSHTMPIQCNFRAQLPARKWFSLSATQILRIYFFTDPSALWPKIRVYLGMLLAAKSTEHDATQNFNRPCLHFFLAGSAGHRDSAKE